MTNSSAPRSTNHSAPGRNGVWDGAENRPLAVVTGASSGIGYNLARLAALNGFDLVVAADEDRIRDAAPAYTRLGVNVRAVEADLSTENGVDALYAAVTELGRPVEALFANAGRTLGDSFLNQDWREGKGVINTNVLGTTYLLHKFGRDMRERGRGRILITGSVEGYIPGSEQALYNATKAFLNSFAVALHHELMGKRRNGNLPPSGRDRHRDLRSRSRQGYAAGPGAKVGCTRGSPYRIRRHDAGG